MATQDRRPAPRRRARRDDPRQREAQRKKRAIILGVEIIVILLMLVVVIMAIRGEGTSMGLREGDIVTRKYAGEALGYVLHAQFRDFFESCHIYPSVVS